MSFPMRSVFHKGFWAVLLLLGMVHLAKAQFKVPAKPAVLYPVYDATGILTASEKDALNKKLIAYNDSTSVQIQVVILPTTNGEDVNFAAWEIGEKWGIRNKEVKNGIVFLIAKDDRTMSIQQGRDAEGALTASVAGQILDLLVTPAFKKGDFYQGIDAGTTGIMDSLAGKFKPLKKKDSPQKNKRFSISPIFIFLIILLIIFLFRGGGGRNNRNDDDDDYILTKRGRRRYSGGFFPFPGTFGGGGFGSGSGGFGSGGGFGGFGGGGSGGFGGGGASGSW